MLRGDLPKVFLVLHPLSLSKIVDAVKKFQSVCEYFSFRIFGWMFKMRGVGTAQHWLRRFTSWAHDMQSIWRQLLRVPTFALISSFFLSYNQWWWWWKRGYFQYKYTRPWVEQWGIIFIPFVIISCLHLVGKMEGCHNDKEDGRIGNNDDDSDEHDYDNDENRNLKRTDHCHPPAIPLKIFPLTRACRWHHCANFLQLRIF